MPPLARLLLAPFLVAATLAAAGAVPWSQFRGPGRDGVSHDPNVPLNWGPDKNIKWKADLPRPGQQLPDRLGRPRLRHLCRGPARHAT